MTPPIPKGTQLIDGLMALLAIFTVVACISAAILYAIQQANLL
jgi:hypothetical protein